MYEVSKDYINETNKYFLGLREVSLGIKNRDLQLEQSFKVSETETEHFKYCIPVRLFDFSPPAKDNLATFEKNKTKADGKNKVVVYPEVTSYVTAKLSDSDPNEKGVYELNSGNILTVVNEEKQKWTNGARPLQLDCDDEVYSANVNIKYVSGTEDTFAILNEENILLVEDTRDEPIDKIQIKITALTRPLYRGRIYRIGFGNDIKFPDEDIVGIVYRDENDCIGELLPSKTLVVTVKNNGYISDDIYEQERAFIRLFTQAFFKIRQEAGGLTEEIPMGRWFLNKFTFLRRTNEITFDFFDAVGLFNEFVFYWGREKQTIEDNLYDLFAPVVLPHPDGSQLNLEENTEGYFYGVRALANPAKMANSSLVINSPMPVLPHSWCLQLLGNISGNYIRTDRKSGDISLCFLSLDILPHREIEVVLEVDAHSEPSVGGVKVIHFEESGKLNDETIATNLKIGNEYVWRGHEGIPEYLKFEGASGDDISFVNHPHAMVMRSKKNVTATVVGGMRDLVENDETFIFEKNGYGQTITVKNPLLNQEHDFKKKYAKSIFAFKKNNVFYDLVHRGYPELDCGDVVNLKINEKTETELAQYVSCLVVENTVEYSESTVRGKTILMRIRSFTSDYKNNRSFGQSNLFGDGLQMGELK